MAALSRNLHCCRNPSFNVLPPPRHFSKQPPPLSLNRSEALSLLSPKVKPSPGLTLSLHKRTVVVACSSSSSASSSSSSSPTTIPTTTNNQSTVVADSSTRTISTIAALAFVFIDSIRQFPIIQTLTPPPPPRVNNAVFATVGRTLFFATLDKQLAERLVKGSWKLIALGLASWLDISILALLARAILSWFPVIPWDREPFSAIRRLSDPYLNCFRMIVPPFTLTFDFSYVLALVVLAKLEDWLLL